MAPACQGRFRASGVRRMTSHLVMSRGAHANREYGISMTILPGWGN